MEQCASLGYLHRYFPGGRFTSYGVELLFARIFSRRSSPFGLLSVGIPKRRSMLTTPKLLMRSGITFEWR